MNARGTALRAPMSPAPLRLAAPLLPNRGGADGFPQELWWSGLRVSGTPHMLPDASPEYPPNPSNVVEGYAESTVYVNSVRQGDRTPKSLPTDHRQPLRLPAFLSASAQLQLLHASQGLKQT